MKNHGLAVLGLLFATACSVCMAADEQLTNLLSLEEGALPVVVPKSYSGWNAEHLLDNGTKSGWACEEGNVKNNVFVFEMAEPAILTRFEFDNLSVDTEGAGAKDILVEVSNTSEKTGFVKVLETALADKRDGQSFPSAKGPASRWVRLTIKTNQGSTSYTELFSFRGYGKKPPSSTPEKISGTYSTNYNNFHLRQQGTALTGCYEYKEGLLDGVIEGRVMKLTWREDDGNGPAVMVFSKDGKTFKGFWWHSSGAKGAPSGIWTGTKISNDVGGCPHWSGSVGSELKKKLLNEKRARVYGILFDTDSDVIRSESRPVLEEVLFVLKGEPGWKLTIEGHTDATGSDTHNQTLSQKRAESVAAFLRSGGIDAGRLTTAGFGKSKPVADNDTELGRAQNRRVELVRQ
ncbi:MAG: OmpA family protein [Bacteroidetes bacterium]|jgi:outer membrane protein OmpA-like peptidoglycan-associated protein|nr:OmpA family protein [Bacteroidota bacterium]